MTNVKEHMMTRTTKAATILSWGALALLSVACDSETTGEPGGSGGGLSGGEVGGSGGASGGGEGGQAGVEAGAEAGAAAGQDGCSPSQEGQEEAQAFLNDSCGLCHGSTPQYGAPFSLSDVSLLNEGEGERLARAVARLVEGTMPPAGQPQPSPADAQAFIDWATCGQGPQRVSPPGGFEVSRPRYPSAGAPPAEAELKAVTATAITLAPDEVDQYRCFLYSGPGDAGEERGIVRFEPSIDNARVVHHIVLYEAGEALDFIEDGAEVDCGSGLGAAIYAWAPGQGALHFTEGALVSGGDKRYLLELHYNNSAGLEDLIDSSGVKLYHTPPQEPRIDMMTFGPEGFTLPPMSRTEVTGYCEVQQELSVKALMPHMHELGVNISSQIQRSGAAPERWEDLISLTGWDFNFQLAYDAQGLTLNTGDLVKTTCLFENDSSQTRRYGPFTEDEMCYQFAYVSPPPGERRCDHPLEEEGYTPGVCAPTEASTIAQPVRGVYHIGVAPSAQGGALPTAALPLREVDIWFEQVNLGPITIDPEASWFEGTGAISIDEAGQLAFDVIGTSHAVSAQGANFELPMELSFAGQTALGDEQGALSLTPSCPSADEARTIQYSAGAERFTLYQRFSEPVEGTIIFTFSAP